MQLKLGVLLLSGFGLAGLQAQQGVPAAGGDASGSGGTAGYSVGQIVYTTNTGTNGSAAQGIQQSYVISLVSGIEQANGITLECSVYPNPVSDNLILKIEGKVQTQYIVSLYDTRGRLLEKQKTEGKVTTISMGDLLNGDYFLKVTDNQKEMKTFKIIKK